MTTADKPVAPRRAFRSLYVQVVIAIMLGGAVGYFFPEMGAKLKPLADGFIKLIKMVIAPLIFTTVVIGMAGMRDLRRLGRIGFKSFLYFEVMTTLALIIGLIVVKVFQPGVGINADVAQLNTKDVQSYISGAKAHGFVDFILNVIPSSVVGAFASGDIIQVLFFSVLFGFAMARLGERARPVINGLEQVSEALFGVIGMIVKLAPIAAFGAIAFTIGKFGVGSLVSLGKLMACVYLTCLVFIILILGTLLKLNGISIFKLLKFIREEIFIVFGTASSESVLPRMMSKMEQLGCSKSIVGLVLPSGYSFNLDGTSIYLTMGAIFIAQATNTHLTFWQELTVLIVCLVTSKGAAAVVGSAFITLAATLSSLDTIPVAGIVLILGVDRLLAEARSVTNLIGNATATVLIAKWENEFNPAEATPVLTVPPEQPAAIPIDSAPPKNSPGNLNVRS